MESSFDLSTLGSLVPNLISVAVLLVGLVLAVTQRARLGSPATGLAVAATGLGALANLLSAFWNAWGVRAVIEGGEDGRFTVISLVGLAFWLAHTVWVGLLLGAVFAGRRRQPVVHDAVLTVDSGL